MAKEMNAIIYPVLLLSSGRQPVTGRFANRDRVLLAEAQRQAARQMEALAKASGGRVFPARSIEDLEPIFPLVESELRSVYTLGYYPANQDLDGAWRTVEVTVDKSDVTVRARPGYYAK
jgi:VWFA-related protein